MTLVIMTKLELVKVLRQIAEKENCHLTLRAASAIVDWLRDEKPYSLASYIERQEHKKEEK